MIFKLVLKIIGGYSNLRNKIVKVKPPFRQFYKLILKGVEQEYGAYLPVQCSISGPITFPHGPHGIFISIGSRIGKECIIYQQVTIGSNMLVDSKGFGYPTIGNNCYIGAGAKIIGNVSIGDNCRIGANAVVTSDIPSNSVVVCSSNIVIQKNEIENLNYIVSGKGLGYRKNGEFILETNKYILKKFEQVSKR